MRSQKKHLPSENWEFWCNIFLQNSKFTDIFLFLAIKDVNQSWEELLHVSTPSLDRQTEGLTIHPHHRFVKVKVRAESSCKRSCTSEQQYKHLTSKVCSTATGQRTVGQQHFPVPGKAPTAMLGLPWAVALMWGQDSGRTDVITQRLQGTHRPPVQGQVPSPAPRPLTTARPRGKD